MSEAIKQLQLKCSLSALADGIFGPGTVKAAQTHYNLSDVRISHFFGQTGHETGNFKSFSENLNYSAEGLNSIFPKYFKNAGLDADAYARNPEKIANVVYANRMGNGDPASGDGWKFRGRGALQLTGKDNYKKFSDDLGNPAIMTTPDLVATVYAFESAIFFFKNNNLWSICDKGVNDEAITALTKRVNGGTHGLDDRKMQTKKYFTWVS